MIEQQAQRHMLQPRGAAVLNLERSLYKLRRFTLRPRRMCQWCLLHPLPPCQLIQVEPHQERILSIRPGPTLQRRLTMEAVRLRYLLLAHTLVGQPPEPFKLPSLGDTRPQRATTQVGPLLSPRWSRTLAAARLGQFLRRRLGATQLRPATIQEARPTHPPSRHTPVDQAQEQW